MVGNPSDGFFGKTISFAFKNFFAEVVLYESPRLEILPSYKDHSVFTSVNELVNDVRLHGYYGGIRLLKATVKRFYDYCQAHDIELHDKNFTLQYKSSIPHGVGLAGSSAIITACMRALMAFYGVSIPKYTQANLILAAEIEELQIAAGLQLTDAMQMMLADKPMYGRLLDGKRYDIGNKQGFIKTNIEFALKDADIADELKDYIKQIAQEL